MRSVVRMAGVVAAAMTLAAGVWIGGGAAAQSPAVSVAVPAPGGGGGVAGCYRVAHTIYGPYNFSFCLNGRGGGSYKVTGGGLNCNGGLDWYSAGGGRTEIDLYRTSCGRGTDWTGDSLTCRPLLQGGNVAGAIGGAIAGAISGGFGVPAPAVPAPGFATLGCTYKPVAGGYSPISVTANRI